jgi:hypothetical protein
LSSALRVADARRAACGRGSKLRTLGGFVTDAHDSPFKECGCGATFTVDEWRELPRVGFMDVKAEPGEDEDDRPFEMRTCSRCGSSIGAHVPYPGGTDYPPQDEALDECASALLDAYVELRRESEALPSPEEREKDALEKFAMMEEIRVAMRHLPAGVDSDTLRERVRVHAHRRCGEEFVAWLDSMMEKLSATEPPVSLERPRRP